MVCCSTGCPDPFLCECNKVITSTELLLSDGSELLKSGAKVGIFVNEKSGVKKRVYMNEKSGAQVGIYMNDIGWCLTSLPRKICFGLNPPCHV